MKSVLDNHPSLKAEVEKVAEVAGYLWQKGWAERNGGNITVNITKFVDDEIKALNEARLKKLRKLWSAAYKPEQLLWLDNFYN